MVEADLIPSASALVALGSVIMTDIALAGDNAIVVGMAAAGLPAEQRRKAILIGIAAAAALRIAFAVVAVQLLEVIGLVLAGGILLLWVSWKFWRELRDGNLEQQAEAVIEGRTPKNVQPKTLGSATVQIIIADISMSLDNVLAVAGAAREHVWVLVTGLIFSVLLMGVAANFTAALLQKHHWLAYLGLLIIVYVACSMIWDGVNQVEDAIG